MTSCAPRHSRSLTRSRRKGGKTRSPFTYITFPLSIISEKFKENFRFSCNFAWWPVVIAEESEVCDTSDREQEVPFNRETVKRASHGRPRTILLSEGRVCRLRQTGGR